MPAQISTPSQISIPKAIRSNRAYARLVGWRDRFEQIIEVLGFTNMTPGEREFALAIADWQRGHPPLKPDGMLGPKTWKKMEPSTRFTPSRHLPVMPQWMRQPIPAADHEDTKDISTNIWFGLGVNYGGHFVAIGKNTGHAWMFSADSFEKQFFMTLENWRLGPGLGGSWGVAFVMISSLSHPTMMNSEVASGWDVQIGLGTRWKEVITKLKQAPRLKKLIEALQASDDVAEVAANPATKQLLKLSMSDWMAIKGRVKELVSASGMKTDGVTPTVATVGVPVPYSALELSAYWEFGNYRCDWHQGMPPPGRGL